MATAARFEGDLRVAGDLNVDGNMPTIPRSRLQQDTERQFVVPLTDMRVHDNLASLLPGSSSADDLAISGGTFGTDAPKLTTGDVKASTVTRYARCLLRIPAEYDAAETLKIRLSSGMETTVADTSATVDVEVHKSDREAGVGSDICDTAAQSINSLTFADKDFTIDATGVSPGDMLDVRVAIAVEDSATGTAVIGSLGAIELLADVKG
jgi:hypothetical protein